MQMLFTRHWRNGRAGEGGRGGEGRDLREGGDVVRCTEEETPLKLFALYLQVSQLKGGGRAGDDLRGLFQGSARLLLAFGSDDLGPGFPGRLGLGGHGPLQLDRQTNVFAKKMASARENMLACDSLTSPPARP